MAKVRMDRRRVVGYARISVDRDEETSTDTQEAAIRSWAETRGADVVDVIVERGKSAYNGTRRPGLDRAVELATSTGATFVVWKLDRLSRSGVRATLELVDRITSGGSGFASVTEGWADTDAPTWDLIAAVVAWAAQQESRARSERTAAWHGHRRRNGLPPTAKPPFGYRRDEANTLEVDPTTGPLCRQIVDDVVAGRSIRSQARALTDAGHPITHHGIVAMLRSPTIAGHRYVDDVLVPGEWPAVVDLDTWRAVQQILDDPSRRTRPDDMSRRWMLSSVARCGRCGEPMRPRPMSARPTRYACIACHLSIGAAVLDGYVGDVVVDALTGDGWERMRATPAPVPDVDVAELDAQLAALAERWAAGELRDVEWDAARTRLLARIDEADTPASDRADELPPVDDLAAAWGTLDTEARRLVVCAVLDRVEVDPAPGGAPSTPDQRARIIWRV